MYEKSRCIANIYDVAKKKNIKIGDLEESCGVSRGYLSRVNKPDYIGSPSIEVLDAIAARLGVGLDYIVSFDKNRSKYSGRAESNSIYAPLTGCVKPSFLACRHCPCSPRAFFAPP